MRRKREGAHGGGSCNEHGGPPRFEWGKIGLEKGIRKAIRARGSGGEMGYDRGEGG